MQARQSENKATPQKQLYTQRLAIYLEKSKNMSSLEKHVLLCIGEDNRFSPKTITALLESMHSSGAGTKGYLISAFNGAHASHTFCPYVSSHANALHLGTTRIWNADGSVNEQRIKAMQEFVAKHDGDTTILIKSTLKAYLTKCYREDKPETNTGRNANSLFSSKPIQGLAATTAWDEIFDRLAGGWITNEKGELEPYMLMQDVLDFFYDSPVVYLKAECGLLPAPKPMLELTARLL